MILAIAENQWDLGCCRLWLPGKAPRKELLEALHRKHAGKFYTIKKDGRKAHVGYIVAGMHWRFYQPIEWPVSPWKAE
jgi:hypothetical protein